MITQIQINKPTSRWYSQITGTIDVIDEEKDFFVVHHKHRIDPLTGRALTSMGRVAKEDCKVISMK